MTRFSPDCFQRLKNQSLLQMHLKWLRCSSRAYWETCYFYFETTRQKRTRTSTDSKKALAVIWAVRLYKYLFDMKFDTVTDCQASKFIYHLSKSFHRLSSAMVQRWNLELCEKDFAFEHQVAKSLPHAYFLSRLPTKVKVFWMNH